MEITFTTKHDVTFRYTSHVQWVEIDIMRGGYKPNRGLDDLDKHVCHIDWDISWENPDHVMAETLAWFTEMHLKLDELLQQEAA